MGASASPESGWLLGGGSRNPFLIDFNPSNSSCSRGQKQAFPQGPGPLPVSRCSSGAGVLVGCKQGAK